jgi:hypothetical protein
MRIVTRLLMAKTACKGDISTYEEDVISSPGGPGTDI